MLNLHNSQFYANLKSMPLKDFKVQLQLLVELPQPACGAERTIEHTPFEDGQTDFGALDITYQSEAEGRSRFRTQYVVTENDEVAFFNAEAAFINGRDMVPYDCGYGDIFVFRKDHGATYFPGYVD